MRAHIAGDHARQMHYDASTRRQVKSEMAQSAEAQATREAADLAKKMALGEEERKGREENRQNLEEAKQAAKQIDFDHKTSMFLRDEAARYGAKEMKSTKQKKRLQDGQDRMKELENERLVAEKEEKKRQQAEKRAFHEEKRRLAAENALLKERTKKALNEKAARDAAHDAERVLSEMRLTHERRAEVEKEVDALKHSPLGRGDIGEKARTAYEAKMRSTYGTGADNPDAPGVDGAGSKALSFW